MLKQQKHAHTYTVSHRDQREVSLDLITVQTEAHIISQLLEIWIQSWMERKKAFHIEVLNSLYDTELIANIVP